MPQAYKNGAKIKRKVNDKIKRYHCTLVMAQQNAGKRHFVGIVFWTGLKSRIIVISWNYRVLAEKDEKRRKRLSYSYVL